MTQEKEEDDNDGDDGNDDDKNDDDYHDYDGGDDDEDDNVDDHHHYQNLSIFLNTDIIKLAFLLKSVKWNEIWLRSWRILCCCWVCQYDNEGKATVICNQAQ